MDYKTPLYIQLRETILQRIKEGEYLPGEKIPSEREMATIYKINRMTVKKAVNSLVEEGYLYKVKNEGTYVRKTKKKRWYINDPGLERDNQGLGASLKTYGYNVENDVLEKSVIENRHYLESKLNLQHGEKVYALYRLRSVEDESLALELTYVPLKYFEDIDEHDFKKVSLYDYMSSKGHLPVNFKQKMTIQNAKRPVDKIMKLNSDDLLYVLEFTGLDENNNVVEFTVSYMRCDKVKYRFFIKQ